MRKAGLVVMAAAIAVGGLGLGRAQAADGAAMAKMHRYFVHHSFGFPMNFYRFHPGPHWDLMHASALGLTPTQMQEERRLTMAMMRDTMRGVARLRQAYRRYRVEARLPNPSIRVLVRDVRSVGRAQAYLGYEMIPYHLKGYRVLDAAQRHVYHRLARENWMHRMRGMHG
ncbi:MAG: hypothetical protein M0Z44_06605 [Gammaproteobacteria bacterium]|nr:hypothetical protein [Gammaproteobacteria bacterium]